jgi:hypothetical protein
MVNTLHPSLIKNTFSFLFCLHKESVMAGLYGVIPDPVSVADAFYAFDGNTLDLYSGRNGETVGGSVTYVQGYVAYGKAIALDQSVATQIQTQPTFNLSSYTSCTIEGFFLLQSTQLNATLIQLTPSVTFNLINGVLNMLFGSNTIIAGIQTISSGGWHHLSFVYDSTQQIATISIDGIIEGTRSSITPNIVSNNNNNSLVIIGAEFYGSIDQLSVLLKAKSQAVILWDATVSGYFPLDIAGLWLFDKGPNGVNATAQGIQSALDGWLNTSLRLNASDAYFQMGPFSPREKPTRSFSLALWVRAETQSGIFLTITNPYGCVLAMGLRDSDNSVVVYIPNSTITGQSVNILGIPMPKYAWAHVAFTWDIDQKANLYQSAYVQDVLENSHTVGKFNTGVNTANLPLMTITLGKYNGPISYQGIDGINTSNQYRGSLDELYIFARQLTQPEVYELSVPPGYKQQT